MNDVFVAFMIDFFKRINGEKNEHQNDNNGENFQSFSKWSFSEYKEYFIKS